MNYEYIARRLTRFIPTKPLITRSNTAEGGTDEVTVTTGNSGGASGDAWNTVSIGASAAIVYSDDFPRDTLGYRFSTTSGAAYLEWGTGAPSSIGQQAVGFARWYGRISGFPAANMRYFAWYTAGGGLISTLGVTPAGKFGVFDSVPTLVGTSTATIPLDEVFRVEYRVVVDSTTGELEARLFFGADLENDIDSPTETMGPFTAQNTGSVPIGRVRYGYHNHGAVTYTHYQDDHGFSNTDWLGPTGVAVAGTRVNVMVAGI